MEHHNHYYTYVELPTDLPPAAIELVGVTVTRLSFKPVELFDQDNPEQNPPLELATSTVTDSASPEDGPLQDVLPLDWTGPGDGRIVGHLQELSRPKGVGGFGRSTTRHPKNCDTGRHGTTHVNSVRQPD